MHRVEIDKLAGATEQAGRTLVPLKMYWKQGRVKVALGIGKGKVAADKRADLKKRVQEREVLRSRWHSTQAVAGALGQDLPMAFL